MWVCGQLADRSVAFVERPRVFGRWGRWGRWGRDGERDLCPYGWAKAAVALALMRRKRNRPSGDAQAVWDHGMSELNQAVGPIMDMMEGLKAGFDSTRLLSRPWPLATSVCNGPDRCPMESPTSSTAWKVTVTRCFSRATTRSKPCWRRCFRSHQAGQRSTPSTPAPQPGTSGACSTLPDNTVKVGCLESVPEY